MEHTHFPAQRTLLPCVFLNVNISKQINIFYGLVSKVVTSTVSDSTHVTDFCKFVLYCMFFIIKPLHLVPPLTINYALSTTHAKLHNENVSCIFQLKKKTKPAEPFNQTKSLSLYVLFSMHFVYRKGNMTEVGMVLHGCLNTSPDHFSCMSVILITFFL